MRIRPVSVDDGRSVRDLFVTVNRELAPPHLRATFETYIARSLQEEIGRVIDYYAERDGGFWVAERAGEIIGMFGLEAAGPGAMELRRMYVASSARRLGVGRAMLQFAEEECRRRGVGRIVLSTSELQTSALELYRANGYRLEREEVAEAATNKTIGGGIRRFHFHKDVSPS